MELQSGNENLIPTPSDWRVGDLISYKDDHGTVEEINIVDGGTITLLFRSIVVDRPLCHILPREATFISRPEDITDISDETLDARLARLRTFNYSPIDPHRKKKAKSSSTRKSRKKDTIVDKTREAVKTGKLDMSGVDKLNAMLEEMRKGE